MKKINILIMALAIFVMACGEEESPNVYRGGTFAEFTAAEGTLIINPSEETQNVVQVGVTQPASGALAFTIEVDPSSTLDPAYYTLSETGVIAQGEFVGDIIITTPDTTDFPASGSELVLNLLSYEGADSLAGGAYTITLGFEVACPSVDISALAGTHDVLSHRFAAFFGDNPTRTVVAGPGDNQITIVEGAVPTLGGEELILNVDPETGAITYGGTDELHLGGGYNSPYAAVFGRTLTCIGLIELTAIQTDGLIDNFLTIQLQAP